MWLLIICLFNIAYHTPGHSSVDTSYYHYNRVFFENSLMDGGYFYSHCEYNTPSWIKNNEHKMPVSSEEFFTPGNSLELKYVSGGGGAWKAAVYYRNWRGKDHFKEGKYLSFKLYVNDKMRPEALPDIAIENEDSVTSGAVNIEDYIRHYAIGKWLNVSIPLKAFRGADIQQSSDILAVVFQQGASDNHQHNLFIDQLEIRPDHIVPADLSNPPILTKARGFGRHLNIRWKKTFAKGVGYIELYRSIDGKHFKPVGIQQANEGFYTDYTGVPGQKYYYKARWIGNNYNRSALSNEVSAATHFMSDSELLDIVQRASFRYYWDGAEPNSGMTLEDIPGRKHMVATGASGFGMMAILVGVKRGFITREQAVQRFTKIVHFLQKADRFHGAFPHFLNGRTGEVVPFFGKYDDGGDLVETSFLMEGLLTARQFFDRDNPQERFIRNGITRLWRGVEWDWYKRSPGNTYLYWHWSPDYAWHIHHRFVGFNETMITYLLAIASPTHGIDPSLYYKGWASQSKYAQQYRSNWGGTKVGSMYTNGHTFYGIKLPVGVSTGGPLFFIHYSYMGFNPHKITDKYTNYFVNNRDIALINYRYCLENPNHYTYYGPGVWGITASDGPFGYRALEPVKDRDNGTIAPTGAISSFPYTPEKSMQALKTFYRKYGKFLWGKYGFRDAFNLKYNWVAKIYMGLNQAPQVVMIENYRSGFIWHLFMQNPEMEKVLNEIKKGRI